MKEWKIAQMMYHNLTEEYTDDLEKEIIIEEFDKDSIVKRATEYPTSKDTVLYYPGKSYAIAIAAAWYLEKYHNENFLEVLDDPDLLYGNDPYFTPYSRDKDTYDKIINNYPFVVLRSPILSSSNFHKTIGYLVEEFTYKDAEKE
jgi:hypothetical protein